MTPTERLPTHRMTMWYAREGLSSDSNTIQQFNHKQLLNATAEVELGRHIQQHRRIQFVNEQLREKLGREPTSHESSRALQIRQSHYFALLELGRLARAELIDCNSLLVMKIAHIYRFSAVAATFDELIQEGHRGLIRAVEKYDPERGFRFSTYAYWWIRKFVQDAALQRNRVITTSATRLMKVKKISAISSMFYEEKERHPTLNELSKLSGYSTVTLRRLHRGVPLVQSDNAQIYESTSHGGGIIRGALSSQLDTSIVEKDGYLLLREAMRDLSENERHVVERRLWLSQGRRLTYKEIGEEIGLDRRSTEFIMYRALSKLRDMQINHN